jgi:hypothetical protein
LARRIDIRNWIASRQGDYFSGEVDVPTVGAMSYTTLTDSRLTQLDRSYWKDRDIVLDYGDGTYDQRRIVDYVPSISGMESGVIRVDATLSKVPSTNTTYFLYRKFAVDDYNIAINSAIRNAAKYAEVTRTDESLVATQSAEYIVPTTADISRILDIYHFNGSNSSSKVYLSKNCWEPRIEGGVLKFRVPSSRIIPEGNTIGVEGAGPPHTLDSDGDELDNALPSEYVVAYAAAMVRMQDWGNNDPDSSAQQVAFNIQQAEAILKRDRPFVRKGRLVTGWF